MKSMLIKLVIKIILLALAVFFAGNFVQGFSVDNVQVAGIAALAIILVNTFIKPLVKLICLPINLATLGLFSIVINVALMYAVIYYVPGLNSADFLSTITMAFALAVLSLILNFFL